MHPGRPGPATNFRARRTSPRTGPDDRPSRLETTGQVVGGLVETGTGSWRLDLLPRQTCHSAAGRLHTHLPRSGLAVSVTRWTSAAVSRITAHSGSTRRRRRPLSGYVPSANVRGRRRQAGGWTTTSFATSSRCGVVGSPVAMVPPAGFAQKARACAWTHSMSHPARSPPVSKRATSQLADRSGRPGAPAPTITSPVGAAAQWRQTPDS